MVWHMQGVNTHSQRAWSHYPAIGCICHPSKAKLKVHNFDLWNRLDVVGCCNGCMQQYHNIFFNQSLSLMSLSKNVGSVSLLCFMTKSIHAPCNWKISSVTQISKILHQPRLTPTVSKLSIINSPTWTPWLPTRV